MHSSYYMEDLVLDWLLERETASEQGVRDIKKVR
jgi:hypothetical protein